MTGSASFLVVEVQPITTTEWLVRGRAYQDIHIGDVLFTVNPENTLEAAESFRVISITSYGYTIDTLYGMMTGDLTLHGEMGNILPKCSYLDRGA
ncbi:hypothetical protein ARNL5_01910 [Anaerolineae bacterium]|nr:hypothetical protein ARNL5_01910 [Anaerolineae bacterium]